MNDFHPTHAKTEASTSGTVRRKARDCKLQASSLESQKSDQHPETRIEPATHQLRGFPLIYGFQHVISLSAVTVNKNNIREEKDECSVAFLFHELQKKKNSKFESRIINTTGGLETRP
jgi:hypothetical protein